MECRNKSLDKLYKRRSNIDIPEYQREKVWSLKKKQKFIDTILKGWHVPKLYFRVLDKNAQTFDCVDGQQRLNAIFEFYDGKFTLPQNIALIYGGISYSQLKPEFSDKFDDYEFQIEEIEDPIDDELEQLFLRLQLGTPTNTAEKLNAISGELRNYIKKLSTHDFLKNGISVKDTRYAHFVICAKLLYLQLYKIPSKIREAELEKMLEDNKIFSNKSIVARKTEEILDILFNIFKENRTLLSNRANIISCFLFITHFNDLILLKKNAASLKRFFIIFFVTLRKEVEKGSHATNRTLLDYQDAISRNTDSKDSIQRRDETLYKYLGKIEPKLLQLLEVNQKTKNKTIESISIQIVNLIVKNNEAYHIQNGKDKFKLTPENLRIEYKLGKMISDDREFGDMIDTLYKLIYEGSGDGNRLLNPSSIVIEDIKAFRTDIRHDWKHGKAGNIKAKAKKISQTYEKYTSKKMLSLLDDKDISNLQLLLYRNIITFLKSELNRPK